MKLEELIPADLLAGGERVPRVNVGAITHDSRRVRTGDVFVAISGSNADGHDYALAAAQAGAAAIVAERPVAVPRRVAVVVVRNSRRTLAEMAERFYGCPDRELVTVGVTGTNGKTTTAYLIEHVLSAAGHQTGLIGTIRYQVGSREIPASQTTPESLETLALIREMLDEGLTHLVMEVSSHALDQERVSSIQFDGAVFTNLTQDHFDYHGDFRHYRDAKAKLFRALGADAFAVLNADDRSFGFMAAACSCPVVTYGFDEGAGYRGIAVETDLAGTRFEIASEDGDLAVRSPLVGRHNVMNVLAAVACLRRLSVAPNRIVDAIASFPGVPGRLERVPNDSGFTVFIDYAHTDDALLHVLESLRPLTQGRLIVVMGAGGDRDKAKRPKMGRAASTRADLLVVTSDNPRSEDPEAIIQDILGGADGPAEKLIEPDRRRAIAVALAAAREGDVVLVAGKGHERQQTFRDVVVPFDDAEVVREFFLTGTGRDEV